MTVAAAMLVKDAAATVADAIRSVRPHVDEIAVYLAGESSDGTPEILGRLAAEPGPPLRVEQGVWEDDFGLARERSFEMTAAEWLLVLDADDELVGGDRLGPILTRAEAAGAKAVCVAYDHHDGPDGRSWVWTNRITRRDSGRWEGVVHEVWRGLQPGDLAVAHPAALRVRHVSRDERPGVYRRLAERAAADPERTPRGPMILAGELLGVDDARAAELLETYLGGGHDRIEGDPNTYRLQALVWLVQANERLGRFEQAARWARQGPAYEEALRRAVRAGEIVDPGFYRDLDASTEALASGDAGDLLLPAPVTVRKDLDRNDPCWCGSGVKFKRCHGA